MEEEITSESGEVTKKKKPVMFYVAIFGVQVLASIALLYFVVLPLWNKKASAEVPEETTVEEEVVDNSLDFTFKVDGLTVNPKNSGGKRFAVFEIILSVSSQEAVDELKKVKPIVKDRYISYFRSKTIAELSVETVMEEGREELKKLTGEIIGENKVKEIYFTRFVLQ